jgi:hypothetical protein
MIFEKIDGRMNGYREFKYRIVLRRPYENAKFIEVRNWCWSQWGSSCEYEFWNTEVNQYWCWINDSRELKILLRSEKDNQWTMLKWG